MTGERRHDVLPTVLQPGTRIGLNWDVGVAVKSECPKEENTCKRNTNEI